jgi:hypothetical protein
MKPGRCRKVGHARTERAPEREQKQRGKDVRRHQMEAFGLSKAVKGQAAQFDGILLNGATPDQFYDAQEPCFFFVAYGVYET